MYDISFVSSHGTLCEQQLEMVILATDFPVINPLNAELNPICHLLALLGAHHILHVSRIRVKQPIRTIKIRTDLDKGKKFSHISVLQQLFFEYTFF